MDSTGGDDDPSKAIKAEADSSEESEQQGKRKSDKKKDDGKSRKKKQRSVDLSTVEGQLASDPGLSLDDAKLQVRTNERTNIKQTKMKANSGCAVQAIRVISSAAADSFHRNINES